MLPQEGISHCAQLQVSSDGASDCHNRCSESFLAIFNGIFNGKIFLPLPHLMNEAATSWLRYGPRSPEANTVLAQNWNPV